MEPAAAAVVIAKRYDAADLYAAFRSKWVITHPDVGTRFAGWGGAPEDRYERGWTIATSVPFTDITVLFTA